MGHFDAHLPPLSLPLPSSPFFRIEIDRSELPKPTPFFRRVPHLAVDSGHPEASRHRQPLRLTELRLDRKSVV